MTVNSKGKIETPEDPVRDLLKQFLERNRELFDELNDLTEKLKFNLSIVKRGPVDKKLVHDIVALFPKAAVKRDSNDKEGMCCLEGICWTDTESGCTYVGGSFTAADTGTQPRPRGEHDYPGLRKGPTIDDAGGKVSKKPPAR